MKLALVEDQPTLPAPIDQPEAQRLKLFIEQNLTSELVLHVLEECLVQENATYNSIDFEQALKDIQQKDSGRYYMLKALLEGYATKQGLVMLDPKMVTASYKQRMAQLELLKKMSRFRRFFFRLGQAFMSLISEKTETGAIQEAIQITGEVQIARDELAVLELKREQAVRDADKILTDASSSSRKIIESANKRATESTETIYRQAREEVSKERREAVDLLNDLYERIEKRRAELQAMKNPTNTTYTTIDEVNRFFKRSLTPSLSPSLSVSPSMSVSPSASPSCSPSASWEGDEDESL